VIRYQIRTVALVNIVNDIKAKRLVPNAYFQRNLVWRDVHKREFIDTILKGYPFPQLFFSRGRINLETMTSTSCIVDGQQRSNAIYEFVNDVFAVNGQKFSRLTDEQKAAFLKYEIGVVELDLDNDDPRVREMFKRVNRTSNSLTAIEKLASEYGATAYMVTAKLLADELRLAEEDADVDDVQDGLAIDPGLDDDLIAWAKSKKPKQYQKLLADGGIFSSHETKRKIPLMYTLNIMSTLHGGFFRRNELSLALLEDFRETFPKKDEVVGLLERTAATYTKLRIQKSSMWRNKSNFFSSMVYLARSDTKLLDLEKARKALMEFEADVPPDYAQAAKEAVNNKAERELRDNHLHKLLGT
jgi:Protein of unknown function DUF262